MSYKFLVFHCYEIKGNVTRAKVWKCETLENNQKNR